MSHEGIVKSWKVAVQSVALHGFISFTTIQVTEAQEGFLYLFSSVTYPSLWIILLDSWVILQASSGLSRVIQAISCCLTELTADANQVSPMKKAREVLKRKMLKPKTDIKRLRKGRTGQGCLYSPVCVLLPYMLLLQHITVLAASNRLTHHT